MRMMRELDIIEVNESGEGSNKKILLGKRLSTQRLLGKVGGFIGLLIVATSRKSKALLIQLSSLRGRWEAFGRGSVAREWGKREVKKKA